MPVETDIQSHSGTFATLLTGVLGLTSALLGWAWKKQSEDIADLKKTAHSPDTCTGAAEIRRSMVTREESDHKFELVLAEMRSNREEVLGEVRSLGKKVDDFILRSVK